MDHSNKVIVEELGGVTVTQVYVNGRSFWTGEPHPLGENDADMLVTWKQCSDYYAGKRADVAGQLMLAGVHHARIPKSMRYAMDDLRRRKEIADVQTEPAPPRKWKNSPHYLGDEKQFTFDISGALRGWARNFGPTLVDNQMPERPQDRGKLPAWLGAHYEDAKIQREWSDPVITKLEVTRP